jgi:hypothetical protein
VDSGSGQICPGCHWSSVFPSSRACAWLLCGAAAAGTESRTEGRREEGGRQGCRGRTDVPDRVVLAGAGVSLRLCLYAHGLRALPTGARADRQTDALWLTLCDHLDLR